MSSDDEGGPLAFDLVDDATSRGNTLLVDSRGYSYTRGKESPKGNIHVFIYYLQNKAAIYTHSVIQFPTSHASLGN